MKRDHKIYSIALLFLSLALILTSCGGGGGGDSAGGGGGGSTPGPPFIAAELNSFPTGSVPPGFNSGASVAVLDNSSGASITTATVLMNGVTLTYNVTNLDYEGNVVVAPGASVTLSVIVGGNTYAASGTQFTSYPAISAPVSGATWTSNIINTVTWSGGAPTTNAVYGLGVLDAADPNGSLIWPLNHFLQDVPIGTTSYSIPAASITVGNRLVVVGIATFVDISGAAPGSVFFIDGFNYVPITVSGPTTLASGPYPFGIAVDSTSVYWTDITAGTVSKVGINGGTVTTLASGLVNPESIAVDSTSVYWTDIISGTVKKIGINGGTVTTLASGLSSPFSIAVDSTSVYWTDYGTVKKVGLNGGTITTLASGLNTLFAHYMAIDSTSVYWTDYGGGTVNKVGINGGTVTTLASGLSGPNGIAIDTASVYWIENIGETVSKVGINGGTVTTLASGLNMPVGITVDSTGAYWTEYLGGTVKKVGINGGTVTTLASGLISPFLMAEDSTTVYWTDITAGTVNKIAK